VSKGYCLYYWNIIYTVGGGGEGGGFTHYITHWVNSDKKLHLYMKNGAKVPSSNLTKYVDVIVQPAAISISDKGSANFRTLICKQGLVNIHDQGCEPGSRG
jgi:hypothetical protein